jgi:hypothetical protein
MKKLLLTTLCAAALSFGAFAQGTFSFGNGPSTLWLLENAGVVTTNTGNLGGYVFELYRAPAGTTTDNGFVGTGILATNLASAGRLNGGTGIAVPGAPLGGTGSILVRGWSLNLGSTWTAAATAWALGTPGYLGSSAIASQFLWGGDGGSGPVPASPAFAGSSGIQTGVILHANVPEPTSMALAGLGAASLLLFRRRK